MTSSIVGQVTTFLSHSAANSREVIARKFLSQIILFPESNDSSTVFVSHTVFCSHNALSGKVNVSDSRVSMRKTAAKSVDRLAFIGGPPVGLNHVSPCT